MPEAPPESPSKGIGCFAARIKRDAGHCSMASTRQATRSALQTSKLHIALQGHPEGREKPAMKVELRERCDCADSLQIKVVVQMLIDVLEHTQHPFLIALKRRPHVALLGHVYRFCSTDLAVVLVAWVERCPVPGTPAGVGGKAALRATTSQLRQRCLGAVYGTYHCYRGVVLECPWEANHSAGRD